MTAHDVIVLGLGAIGSAAACHIRSAGDVSSGWTRTNSVTPRSECLGRDYHHHVGDHVTRKS
jgi:3-hydroxyisobutyrate dehydrogenase-like beta-hydroxyacid dehydrogenase